MNKNIGVIGAIFNCVNCGKVFDGYKNAQALAAKHAKHYKHLVQGEVVISCDYDGRD